jgi:magnesium-transporting ATPase (P-type)
MNTLYAIGVAFSSSQSLFQNESAKPSFDSAIKKMTVVYDNSRDRIKEVYTKGAPETVIPPLL